MNGSRTDLYVEHLKGQAQFAYLQLGLAASAMAFAIHETDGKSLYGTPWPIGAAAAYWALSFALGCFGVSARQRAMQRCAEAEMAPTFIAQRQLDRPPRCFRWQLLELSAGALFYIAGHIMQMATVSSDRGVIALPYDIDRPPFPGRGPG